MQRGAVAGIVVAVVLVIAALIVGLVLGLNKSSSIVVMVWHGDLATLSPDDVLDLKRRSKEAVVGASAGAISLDDISHVVVTSGSVRAVVHVRGRDAAAAVATTQTSLNTTADRGATIVTLPSGLRLPMMSPGSTLPIGLHMFLPDHDVAVGDTFDIEVRAVFAGNPVQAFECVLGVGGESLVTVVEHDVPIHFRVGTPQGGLLSGEYNYAYVSTGAPYSIQVEGESQFLVRMRVRADAVGTVTAWFRFSTVTLIALAGTNALYSTRYVHGAGGMATWPTPATGRLPTPEGTVRIV